MSKKMTMYLIVSVLVIALAACASPPTPPRDAEAPSAGDRPEAQAEAAPVDIPVSAETSPPASPDETASTEVSAPVPSTGGLTYPIVDTGQGRCYNAGTSITCPAAGEAFYGQDAQFTGHAPSYTDNGDGTVTDNVTGLTWQQSPDTDRDGDIDAADKLTYAEAGAYCEGLSLAGRDDWRLPDIKTLYSLIDFRGTDPIPEATGASGLIPFIDTETFDFAYGDTAAGERVIDAQFASSTRYVATTMGGAETMFGVNFADGRIKGYGLSMPRSDKELEFYVRCVRGNAGYGVNSLTDNGDGTITDAATGLMWAQDDSGGGMTWEDALAFVEARNAENYLGYGDWRLPNAKELQSIVDYDRAPDATGSAAIDPLFNVTGMTNEAGQADYPFYWTGTTHVRFDGSGTNAVYVAFGRGLGSLDGTTVVDVHGAGCQRADPKDGDPAAYPSWGHGPQGDMRRVFNYVRLVRGGEATLDPDGAPTAARTGGTGEVGGGEQQGPPEGQRGNGGQEQQPPPEAIEACADQTEGDACAFESPHGQVSGTCALVQQQIACVPAGGP